MSTSPEAKQAAERIIDYVAQFADVHKFGRKEHVVYIAGEIDAATTRVTFTGDELKAVVAQARAPLVAALGELANQFEKVDKLYSKDRKVIAKARALAGTGG